MKIQQPALKTYFILSISIIFLTTLFFSNGYTEEQKSHEMEINRLHQSAINAYYASRYDQALDFWRQGLAIAQTAGNPKWIGDFLNNIGLVYWNIDQYEKALTNYKKALSYHRKSGDRIGESNDLCNIGLVYDELGRYHEALDYGKQALSIRRLIGDKHLEGDSLANIGVVLDKLCRYEDALESYKKALLIHKKVDDKRGQANDIGNIGLVYYHLSQYDNALDYYEQALTIRKEIKDRRGESGDLSNIGAVYDSLGQYEKALTYYKNALVISEYINDWGGQANDLGNIGLTYNNLSQYGKALEFYKRALVIHKKIGDQNGKGNDLAHIGIIYKNIGQYEKALIYYEEAHAIFKKIGDKRGEGNSLINIGLLHDNLGKYDKALKYYMQAMGIKKEIKDRNGESKTLGNIGLLYDNLGQYDKALKYYNQSLAIDKEIGDRKGESAIYLNIGNVYNQLNQYDKAIRCFSDSLKISKKINAPENIWLAQRGLAIAQSSTKMNEEAIKSYMLAINSIEKIRQYISAEISKTSFFQGRLYVYDEFVKLLQILHPKQLNNGYDRKSLEIFELKQSRIFLEQMGKSSARNYTGIPVAVIDQENQLSIQIAKLQSDLVKERSKLQKDINLDRIRSLETQIEKLKAEEQGFQERIKKKYRDYYALKHPKPIPSKEIQANVLKSNEMILVYGVMKETTCLWVIGKQEFGFYRINIGEQALDKKVMTFRKGLRDILKAIDREVSKKKINAIAKQATDFMNRKGQELFALLIPQVVREQIAKAEVLYFVPTGSLYALPFEALRHDGKYLIENHAISYLSSVSLLKILRDAQARKRKKAEKPLLAFANPVYKYSVAINKPSKTDDKGNKNPSNGIATVSNMRNQSYLNLMSGSFEELPETEDMAKSVMHILNASEESLQLRDQASLSKVREFNNQDRLDNYRYVIFGCHGIIPNKKETNPVDQPALVLSLPDPVTKENEYLTMADVFSLKMNADLIALTACNTGRGKRIRGEGVMGLTRAFMYAGTPAVSVTLWTVESQSAKTLSVGLFKYMKEGKSRAEALRAIKMRMIAGEEGDLFRNPFFWAPMVIFGDGQ